MEYSFFLSLLIEDRSIRRRNLMKNELLMQFNLNEDEADEVSKDAYEIYCRGDGQTKYECIEEAYNNFIDNRKG